MTTTVDPISHEVIDRILAGQHHDPHSVLGAHEAPEGTVVRALRPLARSVEVVLPDGTRYPMQHVHEGVFSATVPPDGDGRRLPARGQLRRRRHGVAHGRPVPAPADARRDGPAPDRRGQARGAVAGARRQGAARSRRHLVRGVGAERARRARDRRLQPLGWPRPSDALARQLGRMGAVRTGSRLRRSGTSTRSAVRTAPGIARPIRWPPWPRLRPRRRRSSSTPAMNGPTRTG